jgi:hypothetical protein
MALTRPGFKSLARQIRSVGELLTEIAEEHEGACGPLALNLKVQAMDLMKLCEKAEERLSLDPLPKGQAKVFDYIRRHIAKHGMPPSRVEIAKALNFSSPNAAQDHLERLAAKGVIELQPGIARGIRVTRRQS